MLEFTSKCSGNMGDILEMSKAFVRSLVVAGKSISTVDARTFATAGKLFALILTPIGLFSNDIWI